MLRGPALVGMPVPEPAASVRLLLPNPGATDLVLPTWNGNEFLLPDGSRPILRTLTPWRDDPASDTLAVDVVLHGTGPLARWAARAEPGDRVAVSGPGRGSAPEPEAPAHLLLGDESALPAIEQVLAALAPMTGAGVRGGTAAITTTVTVVVEIDDNSARLPLHRSGRRPSTSSGGSASPVRPRVTSSSTPRAPPCSPRAPGSGPPGRPRRCSASGASCSRCGRFPVTAPWSAATGRRAAVSVVPDASSPLR